MFGGLTALDSLVSYRATLSSDVGGSSGSVVVPGVGPITNPHQDDTLTLGNPVQCSWSAAQQANFYEYLVDAQAYDSAGQWLDYREIDTFLTAVSYTLPASFFDVPGARYYEVYLDVFPFAGPLPYPGARANMTGATKGFLMAEGVSDFVSFFVGTPVKASHGRNRLRPTVQQRMEVYQRLIQ
jgi:hypothetical protein